MHPVLIKEGNSMNRSELVTLLHWYSDRLNSDGYLSFEEVGSLRLTEIEVGICGYRWVDGLQLIGEPSNRRVLLWVCNENSLDIRSVELSTLSEDRLIELYDKARAALGFQI